MAESKSLSVIIPARDEETNLERCIKSIRDSLKRTNFNHEIIVVANRCTDRTPEIARELGCTVVEDQSKNLAKIRNHGAEHAQGDLLVTIDADSIVSEGMFKQIEEVMSTGNYIGGSVLIKPERWSLGIFLSGLMLLPIVFKHGIGGGLFFCERKDFFAIKGFNEKINSAEDIDFAKRLKAHGRTTGKKYKNVIRNYIVTSCRKFDYFGDWYFVLRPLLVLKLLKNKDPVSADRIWYDFPRIKKEEKND